MMTDDSAVVALRNPNFLAVGQRYRTELALRYNRDLAGLAAEIGLKCFNIREAIIDRLRGVVLEFFKNQEPTDHHLAHRKRAEFGREGAVYSIRQRMLVMVAELRVDRGS